MRIDRNQVDNKPVAVMSHQGEVIRWNGTIFDGTNILKDELDEAKVFEHINAYWQYQTSTTQDHIFDVYKRIKETFNDVFEQRQLTQDLRTLVAELFQYHDLEKMRYWVDMYATNIFIPPAFQDVFASPDSRNITREKTYIKEDYRWLVTLSIALRCMFPVWGEFVELNGSEMGTTYKEYYAFKLLAKSSIFHSEPMERLQAYVANEVPTREANNSAILGGVGTEEFPLWLLGQAVVRRLTIGDISSINSNLIANIYTYIFNKVRNIDKTGFVGMVKSKEKEYDSAGQEGENNLSRLEGNRIKQNIPAGDVIMLRHATKDAQVERTARQLCPDLDMDLVRASLDSVQALRHAQIREPQIILTQWVMKPVVSPSGIMQNQRTELLNAIAIAQAVLWHKEYYELAALISAVAQSNREEMRFHEPATKTRIPKELQEVLEKLFPYSRYPQNSQAKSIQNKKPNAGIIAIESLSNQFREYEWKLTLPIKWIEKITGSTLNTWYSAPHDIRIKVAELGIAIATRTFVTPIKMVENGMLICDVDLNSVL